MQAAGGAAQSQSVKYVVVWKKQADGSWKIFRDIWNSLPAPK
jgi:ketosteroid isomerase-like protein